MDQAGYSQRPNLFQPDITFKIRDLQSNTLFGSLEIAGFENAIRSQMVKIQ